MSNEGEIAVRFTSKEDAQLFAAFTKVAAAARKVGSELDGVTAGSGKADASLRKFAEQMKQVSASPLEEVQRKLLRLHDAQRVGLLTQEEYARAVAHVNARYRDELQRSTDAQLKANRQAADSAAAAGGRGIAGAGQLAQPPQEPLERYHARMLLLRDAHEALTISAERYQYESQRAWSSMVRDVQEASQGTSDVDRELRRVAASARQLASTPMDRYQERMTQLGAALRRNMLTQSEFAAAAKRAQDEYQAEVAQSVAATGRLNQAAAGTSRSSADSFLEMATSVRAAYMAVAVVGATVLSKLKQQAQEAGRALADQSPSQGTLAQLATSPEDFKRLTALAKKVRAMGGASTMEEANRFVFAMESAGASSEIETFAQLKNLGIMERPEEMIKYASAVRKSLGADKAGSFRDLVNRAFVAAASSPENAEQVLKGTARAGVAAQQQGVGIDELMAAVSIGSAATGSGEEAGTKMAALLRGLSQYTPEKDSRGRIKRTAPIKRELRGTSLADVLADEELAALSPEKLQKVLGSAEAAQMYGILRENRGEFGKLAPATRQAQQRDLVTEKMGYVQEDPSLAAAARLQRRRGLAEVTDEDLGLLNIRANDVQAAAQARARDNIRQPGLATQFARSVAAPGAEILGLAIGDRYLAPVATDMGIQGIRSAGGDANFLRLFGRLDGGALAFQSAADEQKEAARALDRAARRLEAAAAIGRPPARDYTRAARADAGRDPE